MIKCGKLKGKDGKVADQCILYSKDGSKALGYFPYSKHGGQKGAKAAAHKREGAVQFFKQKHQGLLDALETFSAPPVLKYVLDKAQDDEACQEVVKSYVEKARGEGQGVGGPRQGDGGADQCVCPKCGATAAHEKGTPCAETECPKCGAAMQGQPAEKSESEPGEEVEKAEKKTRSTPKRVDVTEGNIRLRVKEPGQFQTDSFRTIDIDAKRGIKAVIGRLKGQQTTTIQAFLFSREKKWTSKKARQWLKEHGKRRKKKSFDETAEEALLMLQKDEETDNPLEGVDLAELEAWLAGEVEAEVEPTEELAPESEPEPEPEPETEPVESEPEEETKELPNDFRTFLLRDHTERRAGVLTILGEGEEEVE